MRWWMGWTMVALISGCDDGAIKADDAPTLTELQAAVLTPSCSFDACQACPNPKSGLDLSSLDASYTTLVDAPMKTGEVQRVVPGDPAVTLRRRSPLLPAE